MSLPGILIFRLNKIGGLAMLSRGFCDREKSKVQVKSGSENLKPIRDGYITKYSNRSILLSDMPTRPCFLP